jgi:transposase
MKRVMTIEDVAKMLGVHVSSVRRWNGERRKGRGSFPLPFTPPHSKCLWDEQAIVQYIESQSTPPVANTTVISVKQQRRKTQDYQRRQEIAKSIIETHRKTK